MKKTLYNCAVLKNKNMSGYIEVNCSNTGRHVTSISLKGMTPNQVFEKEQQVAKKFPKGKFSVFSVKPRS